MSLRAPEGEILALAAHVYAGTCRWLELVAEFDRRDGVQVGGCRSCAEWIAWRCALQPRARPRPTGAEVLVAIAEGSLAADPDASGGAAAWRSVRTCADGLRERMDSASRPVRSNM